MRDTRFESYLFKNAVTGAAVGAAMVGGILALDIGGIGTLLWSGEDTIVGLVLLFWFFGLTFASVAMGSAIMALGHTPSENGPDRGSRAPAGLFLKPIPVRTPRRHGA